MVGDNECYNLERTMHMVNPLKETVLICIIIAYHQIIVCWHGIWPDGLCGVRPKAAGMRPVACGPQPRSRSSPGSDARHRSPDVIAHEPGDISPTLLTFHTSAAT
jgi:hypothetical protein